MVSNSTQITGKKTSYPLVLPNWFMSSRLDAVSDSLMKTAFEGIIKTSGERTKVFHLLCRHRDFMFLIYIFIYIT